MAWDFSTGEFPSDNNVTEPKQEESVTDFNMVDRPIVEYHCKSCKKLVISRGLPINWFVIKFNNGGQFLRVHGLYCSKLCVATQCLKEIQLDLNNHPIRY